MKRIWLSAILVMAMSAGAAAQTLKVPESWDKLAAKADEVVKVTLDKKMLQFALKFMDDKNDEEDRRLVEKLNGIYVRSLTFSKEGQYSQADVEPIRAQLQGSEWSRIVQVESGKQSKEIVNIYVKTVNNQTVGMVVLAEEPTELTLVHLDGPINPDDLDNLHGNFGIPKSVHSPKTSDAKPSPKAAVKK